MQDAAHQLSECFRRGNLRILSLSLQVLLDRLLLQHVWEQMPDEQLKQTCFSRGGPFDSFGFEDPDPFDFTLFSPDFCVDAFDSLLFSRSGVPQVQLDLHGQFCARRGPMRHRLSSQRGRLRIAAGPLGGMTPMQQGRGEFGKSSTSRSDKDLIKSYLKILQSKGAFRPNHIKPLRERMVMVFACARHSLQSSDLLFEERVGKQMEEEGNQLEH